jgi:hypothetical protein
MVTSLPEDPSPLVSESDRDTGVQRVQGAYAEGHISHEEMDERLHQVLTARTHSELASALASLPGESAGTTSTIAVLSGRIQRVEGLALQAPAALPSRRADDPDLRDRGVGTVEDPPRVALRPHPAPGPPVGTSSSPPDCRQCCDLGQFKIGGTPFWAAKAQGKGCPEMAARSRAYTADSRNAAMIQ